MPASAENGTRPRRVVVTGVGAVTPLGNNAETTWKNLLAGKSGIVPQDVPHTEIRAAGRVQSFDFLSSMRGIVEPGQARRMAIPVQYALSAAAEAMRDAGILDEHNQFKTDVTRERFGVKMGTGIGGAEHLASIAVKVEVDKRVTMQDSMKVLPERVATVPSMIFDLKGPTGVLLAACASGNMAISEAYEKILSGRADIMLTGGTESTVQNASILNSFAAIKALSEEKDDAKIPFASKPFDKGHNGFVMGEGAGVLVLEELGHALAHGRKIYAEVAGYGDTADAAEDTAPDEKGEGQERALRMAIIGSEHLMEKGIVYVNAHGTSTPIGDPIELKSLRRFKGRKRNIFASSTKSMTGHLLGAAGGVEAVFSVLALDKGVLPPTAHLTDPIGEAEDMDLIPNEAKVIKPHLVINSTFGFGGLNSVTAFKRLGN